MTKGLILGALALTLMAGTALADTSSKRIALSNNYAGNSWRQAMLESWAKTPLPRLRTRPPNRRRRSRT
jgi:ribose transport system substrate-binding protein